MQNINFIKKKIKEKNFKYAEKSLKELISKDNNNYEYFFLLGYTYELQGDFNNAIKSYVKAKLINKTDDLILENQNFRYRVWRGPPFRRNSS